MAFKYFPLRVSIVILLLRNVPAVVASTGPPVEDVSAGIPLFEYESLHLSEENINHIRRRIPDKDFERLFAFDGGSTLRSGECRAYPGDAAWPEKQDWDALDDLLGGALIPTIPVAASCYHDWGVFDEEKCGDVIANFSNPYFQYVRHVRRRPGARRRR